MQNAVSTLHQPLLGTVGVYTGCMEESPVNFFSTCRPYRVRHPAWVRGAGAYQPQGLLW